MNFEMNFEILYVRGDILIHNMFLFKSKYHWCWRAGPVEIRSGAHKYSGVPNRRVGGKFFQEQ